MPTTRPRVPGWHPDPDDPGSMRHWDGRRWGAERRPRPTWARPKLPPAGKGDSASVAPEATPPSSRRWWVLATLALALGLLVVSVPAWLDTGPDIPPRSVEDTGFTDRADAVCGRALPPLRRQRPEARQDTGSNAAFAATIDEAADGLEKVARELRAVPVAQGDGAEVDGWLDDWDAYIAVGRRYADRTRAGDDGASEDTRAQAAPLERRIYVFAEANGMPACTL